MKPRTNIPALVLPLEWRILRVKKCHRRYIKRHRSAFRAHLKVMRDCGETLRRAA